MLRALYNGTLFLLAPAVVLRLLWRSRRLPAYRRRIRERFGRGPRLQDEAPLWVHAVSVGEVQAARPLIERLRREHPGLPVLVTTTTPTGAEQVQRLFGDTLVHRYLPYDLPFAVARFLDEVRPRLALVMETELWPNLFRACRERGIPLLLANARLSQRSWRRYRRWFRRLAAEMLDDAAGIAVQSAEDRERFLHLGAAPEKVRVCGNTKFDLEVPASLREQAEAIRAQWGPGRPVLLAASTHAGEEAIVLEAHRAIRERFPRALLVLVPRHPERFDEVAERVRQAGWTYVRRTSGEAVTPETAVYLADTMGELQLLYGTADVAFLGGSLVPAGGHNPLEAAALGIPILHGPHMENAEHVRRLLAAAGAGQEVTDAGSLAHAVIGLFADPAERARRGERAAAMVAANRGARDCVFAYLQALLAAPGGHGGERHSSLRAGTPA